MRLWDQHRGAFILWLTVSACTVLLEGCGAGTQKAVTPGAHTTGGKSQATAPRVRLRIGSNRAGPYRFVRRPIVVRWQVPPNARVPHPSFLIYYRLNRALPTSSRHGRLIVSVDGDNSDNLNGLGYDDVEPGHCYFEGSSDPGMSPVLAHRHPGQNVALRISFHYPGLDGVLSAAVPLSNRLPFEAGDVSDFRRFHQLGCSGKGAFHPAELGSHARH
jgi:hypothetical protein